MAFDFYVILYSESSDYMDVLTQIRKPVEREMKDFESLFGITLQHQNPLLMIALRHVLSRKGKLMRPILTLLAAKSTVKSMIPCCMLP